MSFLLDSILCLPSASSHFIISLQSYSSNAVFKVEMAFSSATQAVLFSFPGTILFKQKSPYLIFANKWISAKMKKILLVKIAMVRCRIFLNFYFFSWKASTNLGSTRTVILKVNKHLFLSVDLLEDRLLRDGSHLMLRSCIHGQELAWSSVAQPLLQPSIT